MSVAFNFIALALAKAEKDNFNLSLEFNPSGKPDSRFTVSMMHKTDDTRKFVRSSAEWFTAYIKIVEADTDYVKQYSKKEEPVQEENWDDLI